MKARVYWLYHYSYKVKRLVNVTRHGERARERVPCPLFAKHGHGLAIAYFAYPFPGRRGVTRYNTSLPWQATTQHHADRCPCHPRQETEDIIKRNQIVAETVVEGDRAPETCSPHINTIMVPRPREACNKAAD